MQDTADECTHGNNAAVHDSLASFDAAMEVDEHHGDKQRLDDLGKLLEDDEETVEEQLPAVDAHDCAQKTRLLAFLLDLFLPGPIKEQLV